MAGLGVFNSISLDGFFTDINGDMRFAHKSAPDAEWDDFVAGNARGGGILLFGRITYELMAGFWPTPAAAEQMPDVARNMNALQKIVFSRTLEKVTWQNTRLIKDDPVTEVRKLKQSSGDDMVILGSGSIVTQLSQAGLIDEMQLVVIPTILGQGRTMFEGINEELSLNLKSKRIFRNGNVLLCYEFDA